ncbi:MAG: type II toxin-antitoxin system death-on-curing family toxin [Actinomycetota bacterium]
MPNKFLSKRLLVAIHRDLIARFGGDPGIRDEGLLDSALAQPLATYGGELLHPTLFEQAAAYLFHLAQNHPFVDGNKRIAFAAADVFLRINGWKLTATDEDSYEISMRAASGKASKSELAGFIEANSSEL